MSRPLYKYGLAIVAAFLVAGIGIGLAANFTLGLFIETFVEPGNPPTDNLTIGLMLLTTIFTLFMLGPIVAGGMSFAVGHVLPERRMAATVIGGGASLVGFYLMVGVGMFLAFAVLGEYSQSADGAGGMPFSGGALLRTTVEVSLPVGIVGAAASHIGGHITDSGTPDDLVTASGSDD